MTMRNLKINQNEKGFTLIELMIVIAIIGILAAIAIPNYISYRDKAFCSGTESDAQAIGSAMADYFSIPANTQLNIAAGGPAITIGTTTFTLSNLNTYGAIAPLANGHYSIVVTDVSTRCPLTYQAGSPKWSNAVGGTYTITL